MGAKHGTAEQRFWPKVAKAGADECWLWTASIASHGYGCLRVDGKTRTAHTLAWELSRGPIPAGMFVCHHCDVKACCNPAHLFLGTAADNAQDMGRKGRHPGNGLRGDRHPNARLTSEIVASIRTSVAVGVSQSEMARRVGVTVAQVNNIIRGKQWVGV